jgi:hypothetical protein
VHHVPHFLFAFRIYTPLAHENGRFAQHVFQHSELVGIPRLKAFPRQTPQAADQPVEIVKRLAFKIVELRVEVSLPDAALLFEVCPFLQEPLPRFAQSSRF